MRFWGLGFGVWKCGGWGLGIRDFARLCGVEGSHAGELFRGGVEAEERCEGSEFRVEGQLFEVEGLGLMVWGLGFRV